MRKEAGPPGSHYISDGQLGGGGGRTMLAACQARCPLSCSSPEEQQPHVKACWLTCSNRGDSQVPASTVAVTASLPQQ